jgi:hypothetical protein
MRNSLICNGGWVGPSALSLQDDKVNKKTAAKQDHFIIIKFLES